MGLNPNGDCVTPNDLWSDVTERQQVEREIERIIVGHFRTSTAAQGAIDIFVDPATNGPQAVTDWLSRNSFGKVIDKKRMMDGFAKAKYAVPDIITNRGAFAKSEFYEIKPKSAISEGVTKIVEFSLLNADFNLLFFPGTDYDPNVSIPFGSPIVFAGDTYDIQLRWFRHGLGLILYELCYRRRQKQKQEAPAHFFEFAFLLFLGIILLIMTRGKGLGGLSPQGAGGGLFGPPDGPSA
jgi:hypothetical protein